MILNFASKFRNKFTANKIDYLIFILHIHIHSCMVNGKEVSGPLFDFALLMFHNAERLHKLQIGPYFYLSKVSQRSSILTMSDYRFNETSLLSLPL